MQIYLIAERVKFSMLRKVEGLRIVYNFTDRPYRSRCDLSRG